MSQRKRVPSYRHHRPTGQAVVTLGGKDFYLGRHGSEHSRQRYAQLISEWAAHGRIAAEAPDISVVELIASFWQHAERFYRAADGRPTSEIATYRQALKPLKALYGLTPVREFGPRALRAVRQEMIQAGWCRSYINKQVSRVRAVFKWGVAHEMVEPQVYGALQAVTGLQRGRTDAPEPEPVAPAPEAHVEAIRPYMSRQAMAVVDLMLLTAARCGEVVLMRPCDLETSGPVWMYRPATHKNAHRGQRRDILLGPKAQQIVGQFLADRATTAYLFSPREALAERHAQADTHRRPNQKPNARKTDRRVRDHYDVGGIRQAIARACKAAGVEAFTPHQLRHSAATTIRRQFGLEVARVVCGHRSSITTEIYAELDHAKAAEAMANVG